MSKPRQKRAIQSRPATPAYREGWLGVWKERRMLSGRIEKAPIPSCTVGRHRYGHVMADGRKVCLDCGKIVNREQDND